MILRELTGHTGHRRMAADLPIMKALDWDEGELLDQHSAICASDWSLVEVVAQELGPSLRWSMATTTRTTRSQDQ